MKKVFFISDFFADEIPGGAELVDLEVQRFFEQKGYSIDRLHSYDSESILNSLNSNSYYIVSNFTGMSEEVKERLSSFDYSIYEHDHKYLLTRDPSTFTNYKAPPNFIINRDFYSLADNVFCQSKKHKEVVELNLGIQNIVNLGCSLWSEQEISTLESLIDEKKTKASGIASSPNVVKGEKESIEFCKKNNIEYELIPSGDYQSFMTELSKFEKFIFFPQVLESFSRIAVESRILNCQLVTNNNLGCASESWFGNLKGEQLLDFIKKEKLNVLEAVERSTVLKNEEQGRPSSDVTVILNSYRRPYNLKMQIDAIKNQTVKPKQIWLWVNAHDDNEGFDYSNLGVDRIFKNDYNWKFYGRFAAALLADTDYVAIFDDDTIPGSKWFENCFTTMKTSEGILGSAGVTLNSDRYVDHVRCGWPSNNEETTRVDLVGHAWFFKRDWLQYLWREKPTTWDNGEDIQFSYLAQKYGNIQTFCPPHPPEDKSVHGSILGNELGIDNKATSTNSSISHDQFFSERDNCVQTAIRGGWTTVKQVSA